MDITAYRMMKGKIPAHIANPVPITINDGTNMAPDINGAVPFASGRFRLCKCFRSLSRSKRSLRMYNDDATAQKLKNARRD